MEPQSATGYYYLGKLYGKKGDTKEMLQCYDEALSILSDSQEAKNIIAWTLATYPDDTIRDGQKALQLCKNDAFLKKADAEYLSVLAAAYAETGQFKEAVSIAQQALKKAKARKNPDKNTLIQKINACLEQYKQGHPYRDTSPLID